jgi:hypothetical protein
VFFRYSSLNSATIRLEAAKKSNRFKSFSLGHFLTKQLLNVSFAMRLFFLELEQLFVKE